MSPDPERLLSSLVWVRRLARRLVDDEHAADDLAQEAAVAALRARPADRPLRPWLAKVTRNAARQRARSERRRGRREQESARPEGVSDDELSARLAAQRAVVEAVEQLDEPYRRTVLLRWFEGLSPRRIAAREGVPVDTVKTRLKRAHAQLRRRLDGAHGADGRSWVLALIPITTGRGAATGVAAGALGGALAMSLEKIAVAVLILALLGVRALVTDPATTGADEPRSAVAPMSGLADDPVAPPSAFEATPAPIETQREAAPRALREPAPAPLEEDRFELVVRVLAPDGTPAAGAKVTLLDPAGLDPWTVSLAELEGMERMLSLGSETFADDEGLARVRWTGGTSLVVGERAGEYAIDKIGRRTTTETVLTLREDYPLLVRVHDQGGLPVEGIPMALGGSLRATSNAEGLVTFAHAGAFVAGSETVELSFAMPIGLPPTRLGEIERGEEVTVVIPATGTVRVEGIPAGACSILTLTGGGREAHQARVPLRPDASGVGFARVGVDLELVLSTQGPGFGPVQQRFHGPGRGGGETVVRVGEGYAPKITGTLVGPDREPLVATPYVLTLELEDEAVHVPGETDEEARFELAPAALVEGGLRALRFEVGAYREVRAHARIPIGPAAGDLDLGIVRLERPLVLVAGRLVDEDGAALQGGTLSVRGERSWQSFRSEQDGRFAIVQPVGVDFPPDLPVRAEAKGFLSAERIFPVASEGVVIVLSRAGALEASLASGSPRGLRVELVDASARRFEPVRDGSMEWSGLVPGTYTLTVGRDREPPAFEVPGLRVVGGEVCRDPRVQDIELGGWLRHLRLAVLDAAGAPCREGVVWSRSIGSARFAVDETDQDGLAHVWCPVDGALAVSVGAPGHRQADLAQVSADTEIRLERGASVTLTRTGARPTAGAPFELDALLSAVDRERPALRTLVEFERGESADVLLPREGRYRVQWSVRWRGLPRSRSQTTPEFPGGEIDVEAGGTYELELPERVLESARALTPPQ